MATRGLGTVILADSNILIDIFDDDAQWAEWSFRQIDKYRGVDDIVINQIVVAEVAPRFASVASFLADIASTGIGYIDFGADAAFASGRAYISYRRNRGKGAPTNPLPDFLIGGHAQTLGATILTRDDRFYRTYFPLVPLITPDKAEYD